MNRSPWRVSLLVTACFALAAGASALMLVLGHFVGTAVAAGVSVSALVVALATYGKSTPIPAVPVPEVVARLARKIRVQWEEEARVRLYDLAPLPVPWKVVSGSAEGTLTRVLDLVPAHGLIVLGEPGSGKSMLLLQLVLDLLDPESRVASARVPVLLSLASWNPVRQELRDWLLARLVLEYPELGEPDHSVSGNLNRAKALLSDQLLLPVLDGLDEIPGEVRGAAIEKINKALSSGNRLVVSCRTADYQAAAGPSGSQAVQVPGAVVVKLCSLAPSAVKEYLVRDAGGPGSAGRWDPVLAALDEPESPVARALSTPLAVSLARSIYNPFPGVYDPSPGGLPNPAELCDQKRFPTRTTIEKHLCAASIAAAYRCGPDHSPDRVYTASQAQRYLSTLAGYFQPRQTRAKKHKPADIEWWMLGSRGIQPTRGLRWSPSAVNGALDDKKVLLAAIMPSLGLLFGMTVSPGTGLSMILGGGLILITAAGLTSASTDLVTASSPGAVLARDRGTFLAIFLIVGPLAGLAVDTIVYLSVGPPHTGIGPGIGLQTGLVVGSAALAVFTALFGPAYGAVSALIIGTADWLEAWLLGQFVGGLTADLVSGVLIGAITGLLFGLRKAPWGVFTVTRCWLAMRGRLPWDLMGFLADAHQRGVLRQIGVAYQFRHVQVQEYLAARADL